ncbi:unnamed protein product [Urochloa humidicola]
MSSSRRWDKVERRASPPLLSPCCSLPNFGPAVELACGGHDGDWRRSSPSHLLGGEGAGPVSPRPDPAETSQHGSGSCSARHISGITSRLSLRGSDAARAPSSLSPRTVGFGAGAPRVRGPAITSARTERPVPPSGMADASPSGWGSIPRYRCFTDNLIERISASFYILTGRNVGSEERQQAARVKNRGVPAREWITRGRRGTPGSEAGSGIKYLLYFLKKSNIYCIQSHKVIKRYRPK